MIIVSIEDNRERCEARLGRFLYDCISGGSYQEYRPSKIQVVEKRSVASFRRGWNRHADPPQNPGGNHEHQ
jgi:hypothetical protein